MERDKKMKASKTIALLLMLVMLTAVFAGCKKDEEGEGDAGAAFTLTDMTGREIEFDGPVTRIVALTPSDCEILYVLGAGDTVVGRGAYCDYPEEVLEKTVVESGADTNIEEILALEPQVVLMSTMAQTEEQIASLEEAGVKCVVSDAQDIAGVYTAIEMIGKMVGKETEAAGIIDGMKTTFSQVEQNATGDGSKTIYFEISPLEWGLWTAGSGTFMDELATMMGLTNIFADVDGWAEVSEEQVIERNPDYIVTVTMYYGEGPTPDEEIMGRDGWQGITAVQSGAIYVADNNEITRPGPRLAAAAEDLYEFVYVTSAGQQAA